jgi:hypothetical protein
MSPLPKVAVLPEKVQFETNKEAVFNAASPPPASAEFTENVHISICGEAELKQMTPPP